MSLSPLKPRFPKSITGRPYITHDLEVKPLAYMSLRSREALYGGAAGGMKTETLGIDALQYVDIPGYSAILFRRKRSDHELPNCLIPRLQGWLAPHIEEKTVKFNNYKLIFKTLNPDGSIGKPATLTFGYCFNVNTSTQYQGAEFQYVGWDEVCQIKAKDYLYLLSRLRKCVCPIHKKKPVEKRLPSGNIEIKQVANYVKGCPLCDRAKIVPLKCRAAGNPGDISHQFIKDRFQIKRDPKTNLFRGFDVERPFIPAYLWDNPYLDESYEDNLKQLDEVTRKQLMEGDWNSSPDSRYKKHKCRRWENHHGYVKHGPHIFKPEEMRWFFTVDCATTVDTVLNEDQHDETSISLWALSPDPMFLCMMDNYTFQAEIPEIVEECVNRWKLFRKFRPECMIIEKNGCGVGVLQTLERRGIVVKEAWSQKDKLAEAQVGIIKMDQGRILLPNKADWLEKVEGQLFIWTGDPDEPDDIIDTVSRAANYVDWTDFDSNMDEDQEFKAVENFNSPPVNPIQVNAVQFHAAPNYFESSGEF